MARKKKARSTTEFDPYHVWLGIPPNRRPPSYYELLGVSSVEKDKEVIESAALRQTSFVRRFQTGPHEDRATEVLNLLSQARHTLLDPARRQAYDAKLFSQDVRGTRPLQVKEIKAKRTPIVRPMMLVLVGIVVIGTVAFLVRTPPSEHTAEAYDVAGSERHVAPLPISPKPEPAGATDRDEVTTNPDATSGRLERSESQEVSSPSKPATQVALAKVDLPNDQNDDSTDPPLPQEHDEPPPDVMPNTKEPLPKGDAEATAKNKVQDLFKQELAQAKKPEQKVELAKTLLGHAANVQSDLPARYALLRLAMELAVQGDDVSTSLVAIDEMSRTFDIDRLAMQYETLKAIAEGTPSAVSARLTCEAALALASDAVQDEKLGIAKDFVSIADDVVRRAKDRDYTKSVVQRKKEIEAVIDEYGQIDDAVKALTRDADDAKANGIVGRFRCLFLGNWTDGLPHLSKGNEPTLVALAKIELQDRPSAKQMMELAEGWSLVAKEQVGAARHRAMVRSVKWYRKATESQEELLRIQATQRLASGLTELYDLAPLDGLKTHFTFDKIRQQPFPSLVGEATCKFAGDPKIVAGVLGDGVLLDGKDDFVGFTGIDCGQRFTLSFWFKPTSGRRVCLLSNDNPFLKNGYSVYADLKSQSLVTWFQSGRDGKTSKISARTSPFDAKQWHHVAVTMDDRTSQGSIFVDGAMVGSGSLFTGSRSGGGWRLGLFVYRRVSFPFTGAVDELRIYNRVLAPYEIETIAGNSKS